MGRPKINIPATATDRALTVAACCALAALWALVIIAYDSLPEVVPTHFGFNGKADAFGGPSSLFISAGIGTVMFLLLTIVAKYPHKMSYTLEITEANAPYIYSMMVRMMHLLRLGIMLLFILLEYLTIRSAHNGEAGIGGWVIGIMMMLIHLPAFIIMIKMSSYGETK